MAAKPKAKAARGLSTRDAGGDTILRELFGGNEPDLRKWRIWQKPEPALALVAIDNLIAELEPQRSGRPCLRPRAELNREPLNVVCPYYSIRHWIADAAVSASLEQSRQDAWSAYSKDHLDVTLDEAKALRDHILTFLRRSAHPFAISELSPLNDLLGGIRGSSDKVVTPAAIRERGILWEVGGDLSWDDQAELFSRRISAFEKLEIAASELGDAISLTRSERFRVSPPHNKKDAWKNKFAAEICSYWYALTGAEPALAGTCKRFVSAAYAALNLDHDDSWSRQISRAIEQNRSRRAAV